jgi:hypothetical protein
VPLAVPNQMATRVHSRAALCPGRHCGRPHPVPHGPAFGRPSRGPQCGRSGGGGSGQQSGSMLLPIHFLFGPFSDPFSVPLLPFGRPKLWTTSWTEVVGFEVRRFLLQLRSVVGLSFEPDITPFPAGKDTLYWSSLLSREFL